MMIKCLGFYKLEGQINTRNRCENLGWELTFEEISVQNILKVRHSRYVCKVVCLNMAQDRMQTPALFQRFGNNIKGVNLVVTNRRSWP